MPQITLARIEDIPGLCELLGLLFTQEAEFKPDETLQSEGLRQIISTPDNGCILTLRDADSRIIGMANLLFTISTALGGRVALLEDMVIRPDARGKGLGTMLIQAAINQAKQSGCKRITLLTDHDNLAAQGFYQSQGFTPSAMLPMRLFL